MIELGDQHQPAMIRDVDAAGECADFRRKLIDGAHGAAPFACECVQYVR